MGEIKTLAQLSPGQRCRVREVVAPPSLALRILEIGLVKGAVVRFLRAAPLGDPIEVEVDEFLLSLRRSEAASIIVETDDRAGDSTSHS